jgi:aspartyl-tRNA(Asn)/glutamyl-tRNA(Gln) amidotransferase subunit C
MNTLYLSVFGKHQEIVPILQGLTICLRIKSMNQNQSRVKISKEEVKHVADLARLDMDENSIKTFSQQIGNILHYIDTLNSVDTENTTPTSHAVFLPNAFREDEIKDHLDGNLALANAPEKENGNFIVPKVIG